MRYIFLSMFIITLFTISRKWKEARFPSPDESIMKMLYICMVELYSAVKMKIVHFEVMDRAENNHCK